MRIGRKKSVMDRAHDYVGSVAEAVIPQLESAVETARDKAGPALADARDKTAPLLADARDRTAPLLHDAHDKAAPILAESRAVAADKAALGAALAAERAAASRDVAAARLAQLRREPEPKRGKLKKVLLFGGLLAAGGAIFAKLRQSQSDDQWQSSYTPSPPPTPAGPPATPAAPAAGGAHAATSEEDPGGAEPGEALTDAREEPHPATTPDNPAQVVDVDDQSSKG